MGETAKKIGVSGLISYFDDLVRVLQNKKDINNLMLCTGNVELFQSSCDGIFPRFKLLWKPLDNLLSGTYQKKMDECQRRINGVKSEVVNDAELDSLQQEYEELNRKNQRAGATRVSLEEREQNLKKADKDEFREQKKLSMYASVTNIIPNMDSGTEISGHVVEREKRTVETFEFEAANSSSSSIEN